MLRHRYALVGPISSGSEEAWRRNGSATGWTSGASAMKDSSEGALPFVKPDSVHGAARDVLKVFINPQLEEDGGASSSSGVIVNANYAVKSSKLL